MYEFEAVYHYAQGERYNNGRGLSVLSDDLPRLEMLMAIFKGREEPYALSITNLRENDVVSSHGDMAAARASMYRALRVRNAP